MHGLQCLQDSATEQRANGAMTMQWQPIETAPKDGTWILGMNNRGNPAVIIWTEEAHCHDGRILPGWIHPYSSGERSSFWNGACGSLPEFWMPIPWHPKTV